MSGAQDLRLNSSERKEHKREAEKTAFRISDCKGQVCTSTDEAKSSEKARQNVS